METKVCSQCKKEKPIEEFAHNKAKKDGRNNVCKACFKEYRDKHYQEHKDYYKRKASDYRIKAREALNKYKEGLKCSVCGESRWWLLDFHHTNPQEKEKEVVNLIQSPRKLREELKKCIVLCANCHRDLHYKERIAGWTGGGSSLVS